jgi:tRNA-guanine family transglycosylase
VHPVTLVRVKNIKYNDLPECDCSVCQQYSHADMVRADSDSEIILALHNLNIFLREIQGIREASEENNLREYIEKRAQNTNKRLKTAFEIADKVKSQKLLG